MKTGIIHFLCTSQPIIKKKLGSVVISSLDKAKTVLFWAFYSLAILLVHLNEDKEREDHVEPHLI